MAEAGRRRRTGERGSAKPFSPLGSSVARSSATQHRPIRRRAAELLEALAGCAARLSGDEAGDGPLRGGDGAAEVELLLRTMGVLGGA
eukprot:SAG11_NODE_28641_length_319_cov_1.154545_1_plen_87_part_01